MLWAPDRLPIAVSPVAGEGLDSWIEAYARRLRTTSRDLLSFMGLHPVGLDTMVAALEDHEIQALQRATGISGESLTAMTLQPFDRHTINLRAIGRGLAYSPTWRIKAGSHACPGCLADSGGRWQLSW